MIDLHKILNISENKDNSVDMHIYGIIGDSWGEGTNNAAFQLVALIKRLQDKFTRINIHINSPGGSIEDGLAIYNTIRQSKAEIHTYNDGLVGSMAGIIYEAGKVKHASSASIHHIHQPATITVGNISAHEQSLEILNISQDVLIQAIADNTSLTKEDIKARWFDGKEHFIKASDAKDLGLVDVIDDTKADVNNNITNLTYREIIALYQKDKESYIKKLFKNFLGKNTIEINNLNTEKTMEKRFKLTAFVVLANLLFAFELPQDETGNIKLSEEQFNKLANEHKRLIEVEKELNDLKSVHSQLESNYNSLKEKLEKTTLNGASHPGASQQNNTNQLILV